MILRPATVADNAGVIACLERNNMLAWSEAESRRLWDEHPYAADFSDIPRGFVLEADGQIVGTISNLWAKYSLDARTLRAVIASSAAVDPAHRSGSVKLMGKAVVQPGVDLYLNGSPSVVASKLLDGLKVHRVPQPNYDVSLLWPASGRKVAFAGLTRKRLPLAGLLAWPAGAALAAGSALKLRRASATSARVTVESSFSEEFDELWTVRRAQSTQLIGFRDRAMLTWRYMHLVEQQRALILALRRNGRLVGYAILMRLKREKLGVEEFLVHDIQCLDDDPDLVVALLRASWREARRAGLDLLEWVGFSGIKRETAERCSLLKYQLDVWQAYYYTRDPSLKNQLASPERWAFGPYDSD